jgi:ferritin-like metal-binding protein YciE
MSTPATRGELREEIERLDLRLEIRLAQMATKADLDRLDQTFEQRLAQMATKGDLDRLDQKFEQRLAQTATKTDLEMWGGALLERLLTELARHTKAIQETLSRQVSTFDDKYADLPARVSHLETAVFAPKPR